MAFGGDVDTLSLTFDKLQYIFNGYGQIRDSFVEANTMRQEGKVSDAEFFDLVTQGITRFSALEFLAIKAVFEIKKSLDKGTMTETMPNSGMRSNSASGPSLASFITAKSLPQSRPGNQVQDTTSCIHCGNQIRAKTKFCTTCGKKLQ